MRRGPSYKLDLQDFTAFAGLYEPAALRTITPAHVIAGICLLIFPFVLYARYGKQLAGGWNTVYVTGAMVTLYFNGFVLVVQLFRRIPALLALAPTQKEAPFAISQLLVAITFLALGRAALRGSRGT